MKHFCVHANYISTLQSNSWWDESDTHPVRCCCHRCVMCVHHWTGLAFPQSVWMPCHRDLCSRTSEKRKKKEISQHINLSSFWLFCYHWCLSSYLFFLYRTLKTSVSSHCKSQGGKQTHTPTLIYNLPCHAPCVCPCNNLMAWGLLELVVEKGRHK